MLLSEYINRNKINTIELAKKISCGQPMVSLICTGLRRPSPALALRIEQATGGQVSRDELLFPELYQSQSTQDGSDQDKAA